MKKNKNKHEKKPKETTTPFIRKVLNLFKSKTARSIFFAFLLIVALFNIFMLDSRNGIRTKISTALDANFVKTYMEIFGIHEFNIEYNTWLLLFVLYFVFLSLFIFNIFSTKAINGIAEKHFSKKEQSKAHTLASFVYYGGWILLNIVVIAAYYVLGFSLYYNEETTLIVSNLVVSVLLCAAMVLSVPVAILIVYYAIKAVFALIAFCIAEVKMFVLKLEDKPLHDDGKIEVKIAKEAMGDNIFPALTTIDSENIEGKKQTIEESGITLENLPLRFQAYCVSRKIYYELPLIRSFLAGLSASRIIILEGLSGTGKSMLPRMFCEFTHGNSFFAPVQPTWRDKTDLLGYYNEFSKTFKTTDFLKNLYLANYSQSINLSVLDEMNLSRIEYYFADFLSILEYPPEDWNVKVIEPEENQLMPEKLTKGYVKIPTTTWFIGTANIDDSTYTITDKVYDRAITIDFDERFSPLTTDVDSSSINLSAEELLKLFEGAKNEEKYKLSQEDFNKFNIVCEYMKETFDIRFGNRILTQINNFVPIYVALGGTVEAALDFMFTHKILRKLNGAFDEYVKDGLNGLLRLLETNYGKDVFKESEHKIKYLLKRLA